VAVKWLLAYWPETAIWEATSSSAPPIIVIARVIASGSAAENIISLVCCAEWYAAGLEPCPFCTIDPTRIWIEREHAIAVRDAFPVADGHILVVPRKHVSSIYELEMHEQQAVWELVGKVRERLLAELKPDGFNIGFNDGLAAGQTVPHAHVHIIPRREGDVPDPRGGIRWVIAENAPYWKD
jgi:diadenosine tetraphosphate (Ap4A) HIT family hydrolase